VRLDALMVGASGEGPKLFAPPGSPLTSQPASVMPPPVPPASLMVVTSLTVLSAGSTSPPSETAVKLVTLAGALDATLTVMVMGGKLAPETSASERVQVSVPRLAVHPVPLMAVAVRPAGSASVTVIVLAEAAVADVGDHNGIAVAGVALGEIGGMCGREGQVRSGASHGKAVGTDGRAAGCRDTELAGGGVAGHGGGDLHGRIHVISRTHTIEGDLRGGTEVRSADHDVGPGGAIRGRKPVMTGGGLVWPSTWFSSAAATSDGRAVKNVKPVSN